MHSDQEAIKIKKFIYVFDEEAKSFLLNEGYTVIKSDEKSQVYVFYNDETKSEVPLGKVSYILSDTINF